MEIEHMSMDSSGAVVLSDLSVALGGRSILIDLSHVFPPSSVTVILGPNGAGKTTLLRTLIGVIRPRLGHAYVMGHPVGSVEAKGKIGYLGEQPGLYERLSAADNLLFHARLRGLRGDGYKEEARTLLRKYGLEGYENVGVQKFSKGMKQRLALARSNLGRPPVLLLDEPTSGLDPDGSEMVIATIRDAAKQGAAVLMTTHNAYLARRVSDSVMLMKGGRLVATGTFDDVLRPYGKEKVKLLSAYDPSAIMKALSSFRLEMGGGGRVGEFVVSVAGKADIPALIKAMVEAGLQPISVEPGEITYEGDVP